MFQLFQTKDGPIFFIVTLVYTCRAFFCSIIRKYLSHVLFWSQLVSVCFAMKFFFSFKIHCLQMFQLIQTRDGPFFSSSHLSTLVTLFLLYHQKIFVPYIFGCIIKIFEEKISLYNILYLSLQYIVLKIPKLKKEFVTVVTSLQRPFGNPLSFCAIYGLCHT